MSLLSPAEQEMKLVEMLAYVYRTVPWRKVRVKSPHDVFNHRVRWAASRLTLYEAVSRLCNAFGLQSLPPDAVRLCQELRPYERELLNRLRAEHIPLCMMAVLRAKEMRKADEERAASPLFADKETEDDGE